MSNTDKYRSRLISLLKELFQLDQPELDFGLYKIMHAKSVQITRFLENDLLKEIQQAFGEVDDNRIAEAKAALDSAIDQAKKFGAPDPENTEGVKEAKAAYENAKDGGNAEAEIYDHLYRFFERYYDNGDFMSRRYYARESDSRAAPYAVPYDGREVYLHWANKDQYYIKSSEYLTNYTFDLNEAIRQEAERQEQGKGKSESLDFDDAISDAPKKVHFRIVEASEGEHGNIKVGNDQKRFFIIHDEPVKLESGELVVQFQYRADPEKTGQDKTWQKIRLEQAETAIIDSLNNRVEAKNWLTGLQLPAPTDSQKNRNLLGKHLQKYSTRNTMDYFIHKDLSSFLRRELDFYIKNEIMHLDAIENAEAPKVEQYLGKIRVLRRVAHQLIAFLTQLEGFQKKLWLKKKFVTETQYCITLDRIPESFYPEIASNDAQRDEWVTLFCIDEIEGDLTNPGYSSPLTTEFLKNNQFLLIDTKLFDEDFKARLLNEFNELDQKCDGLLIHSENFQGLNFIQNNYREKIRCVYIDPPYNTSASEIIYKNEYKHSSWLSLVNDRLLMTRELMSNDSILCATIDDVEVNEFSLVLDGVFSKYNELAIVPIRINPSGRPSESGFALTHEYALFYRKSTAGKVSRIPRTDDQLARFNQSDAEGIFEYRNLRREGSNSDREDGQRQFFPIYADISKGSIRVPKMTWDESKRVWHSQEKPLENEMIIYPINGEGREKNWRWSEESIRNDYSQFLSRIPQNGTPQVYYKYRPRTEGTTPLTLWTDKKYSATEYGTRVLKDFFNESKFSYPKSIYAVEDCLRVSGASDDNSLHALDYFGGSGTTGHAIINLNREDKGKRKYILIEMGDYFDEVLKPRILKSVYSKDWRSGKPISRNGISHFLKYIRLESYEDTLNNLTLRQDSWRSNTLEKSSALRRDYLLNYFLDVETLSSQSLLNIDDFRDPTTYEMWIKNPGGGEQVLQTIDLIETFNWLIGLWVEHMAMPKTFAAEFAREKDNDLPNDSNIRLICTRLRNDEQGEYWFRLVEGYTLKNPGDKSSRVPTLVIWRKQTNDAEKDNSALQKYLEKIGVSTREKTYEVIYVNGSHTLPNPAVEGEQTKVRLIEEAFHTAMWTEV
ncbi:MAG: site-specific DNA-methyltransferase [Alkalimonas sp.]|nr:site-specific DNA-methyltransferase [Alkalimonas sp.]